MKLSVLNALYRLSCIFIFFVPVLSIGADEKREADFESVRFHSLDKSSGLGIGFLGDGKSAYLGGCRVFLLEQQRFEESCRFPMNLRWAHVSPDGTLLLGTAVESGGKRSISFQIDALTGVVVSRKPGAYFLPPIAIHPSNKYWVAVGAGKDLSASETLTIFNRNWIKEKKGVYAGAQRVFDLTFSVDGRQLSANGGDPSDGAVLDTTTWRPVVGQEGLISSGGLVRWGGDKRLGAKLDGGRILLIKLDSKKIVQAIDIDASRGEPEIAFSSDGRWFAVKGYYVFDGEEKYGFALVDLEKLIRHS